MNAQDKELIETKMAGIHAAIMANQDIQAVRDEKLLQLIESTKELAREARDLGLKTNGRVTVLEKKEINHFNICPNVSAIAKIQNNFFMWFDSPARVVLFLSIIIIIGSSANVIWVYVEKLIKLL